PRCRRPGLLRRHASRRRRAPRGGRGHRRGARPDGAPVTRLVGGGIDVVMPSASRTRVAVAMVFFANGAGIASWVPHIPMVQASLAIGSSVLGFTLLAMAAGALVGIPLSGWATTRLGSRTVVRLSALVFFVALPLPVLAPSVPLLALALFVLGAGNGALDVSM